MAKYEALEDVDGEGGVPILKGTVINVNEIPRGQLGKFKLLGFEKVEQRTENPDVEAKAKAKGKGKAKGKEFVANPGKKEPPAKTDEDAKDNEQQDDADEDQEQDADLFQGGDGKKPWEK